MAYGGRIYIKGTTFEVINAFAANYVLDTGVVASSGSRTYTFPAGFSLRADLYPFMAVPNSNYRPPSVTVSGNRVTWSANGSATGVTYNLLVWCV